MKEIEYYYIHNEKQLGPFSFNELKDKDLNLETLVWNETLDNWTLLKDLPELIEVLNIKKSPPPIPNTPKTKISGSITFKNERLINNVFKKLKLSKKEINIFLIWFGIHSLALITSYSKIDFFSKGNPQSEKFWPFVTIFKENNGEFIPDPNFNCPSCTATPGKFEKYWSFEGLFYRYDWSEFIVYLGGLILVFVIIRLSKKEEINYD